MVAGFGTEIFCVNKDNGSIWRNCEPHNNGAWEHVGDRCDQIHHTGTRVLCVNWGEEASIWEMQGPGDWCKIGGDCDHLYGYDEDLFCVNTEDAGIWWNNSRFEERWERVGDRCKQLHVCDGGLFCVNNEDSSIWKRDR